MGEFLKQVSGFLGDYATFALVALFLENTIFTRALGTSTALLLSRKHYSMALFSLILTVITTLSSIVVFWIYPLVVDWGLPSHVRPLIYILVISLVYVLVLLVTVYGFPKHKKKILPMIHLSAFNCAVLGAILLGVQQNMNFASFLGFGMGVGMGFGLAAFLLSIAYDRLYSEKIPKAFRGFPAMLIYIGILSLSFYGLIGHEIAF